MIVTINYIFMMCYLKSEYTYHGLSYLYERCYGNFVLIIVICN